MKRRKALHAKRKPANRQTAKTSSEQPLRPRLGLKATVERIVEHQHTIQSLNPALPAVLSTPSMIGLMEHATVAAVLPDLPEGVITVGTRIEVDHLKAVPPGAKVAASAHFVEYRGRFLVFDVEARSGEHVIGRGRVFRAIVEPASHGQKAKSRVENPAT